MLAPAFRRKKASEFYFTKDKDESNKKKIHSIDFMSED